MKSAVLRMHAEHARRRGFSLRVLRESVFDRGDAFVERQQTFDVAAAENESSDVGHVYAQRYAAGFHVCVSS